MSRIVIGDEAHRLKDPKGQLSLAMKKFQHASCFALTGTLIQNRLDEMWSVLDFVSVSSTRLNLTARFSAGKQVPWRSGASL